MCPKSQWHLKHNAPKNKLLHFLFGKELSVKWRSMIVLIFALLYVCLFSMLDIKCKVWHPCCLPVCAFSPLQKENKLWKDRWWFWHNVKETTRVQLQNHNSVTHLSVTFLCLSLLHSPFVSCFSLPSQISRFIKTDY